MTGTSVQRFFRENDTFATTLLVIAADAWGMDWVHWDPETIQLELRDTFQAEPSPATFNRLMTAAQLVASDAFYKDLPAFIRICNTLTNGTFDPREFDPADAAEIAWGITEAVLIWPPEPQEDEPFSPEIIAYIGHAVRDEGLLSPPDILRLGLIGDDQQELWSLVQAEFSDDPVMFTAIQQTEKERTEEINQFVKHRLLQLMRQLDSLQTTSFGAGAHDFAQKMLAALQAESRESTKLKPV